MLPRHTPLNRAQCAEVVGLTANTLSNYASTRRGPPFVRCGTKVTYMLGDVLDWVERRTVRVGFPDEQPAERENA